MLKELEDIFCVENLIFFFFFLRMRQFINPATFVLMLLIGSCHRSSDSVQFSLSLRLQFAAPMLVLSFLTAVQ